MSHSCRDNESSSEPIILLKQKQFLRKRYTSYYYVAICVIYVKEGSNFTVDIGRCDKSSGVVYVETDFARDQMNTYENVVTTDDEVVPRASASVIIR